MKHLIQILSVIIFTGNLYAQDCTDYHQYHCPYGDYTFFYSRQSKSMLFHPGQTSELEVVAYGGEDYYIAMCAHRKFGNLRLRILEGETRSVLYDNAQNEYSESIVLSNEKTRNLVLEISVPEGDKKHQNERRCVGVVIQFRESVPN